MAKTPSLAELQASRADIDKQIAAAELGPLSAAMAALDGAAAGELLAALETAGQGLTDGPSKQAVTNVRQIIISSRNAIERAHRNAEIRSEGGSTVAAPAES